MTPRPIYRWKSFWLGVLVLGFVGWACHFSLTHLSGAIGGPFHGTHGAGGVQVGYSRTGTGGFRAWHEKGAAEARIDEENHPGGGDAPVIVFYFVDDAIPPWVKPMGIARKGELTAFLPHWLILLVMTALWSAWLACHWKREQRKGSA